MKKTQAALFRALPGDIIYQVHAIYEKYCKLEKDKKLTPQERDLSIINDVKELTNLEVSISTIKILLEEKGLLSINHRSLPSPNKEVIYLPSEPKGETVIRQYSFSTELAEKIDKLTGPHMSKQDKSKLIELLLEEKVSDCLAKKEAGTLSIRKRPNKERVFF